MAGTRSQAATLPGCARETPFGEIHEINDFITYNLNIRQFAEDAVSNCEGPELLRAFYQAVNNVTILDPTCGSGAFLFAAANILEPLYEACLERMHGFVDDLDRSGERHRPEKFSDFRQTLAEIDRHPNRLYFIYKSIILKNLFGVDIMEEAVEICKLRLFLKLVAQVEKVKDLEPLPDIDFNIRDGNTLVGFTTVAEIRRAAELETPKVQGSASKQILMVSGQAEKAIKGIEEEAKIVQRAFREFHEMQSVYGMAAREFAAAKRELHDRLEELTQELNSYLAREYHIDPGNRQAYDKWRASHQPFHWFAEFYYIMHQGGFDVVIGNPPYVELRAITDYHITGYECHRAGNLYALVIERCSRIGNHSGRQGFIVPVSSISTDRYDSLQRLLTSRTLWYSSFDDRPSRLFEGLEHVRLTIHLIGEKCNKSQLSSTRYNKWNSTERATLFDRLNYADSWSSIINNSLPKMTSKRETAIIKKLTSQRCNLERFYRNRGSHGIFYSRKVGYFLQALDFEPRVLNGRGDRRPPSEFKRLRFDNDIYAKLALCCLNSNLFYWFITIFSDCRHVNRREVDSFPIDLAALSKSRFGSQLELLCKKLMTNLTENSVEKRMSFSHDTLIVQCIIPKMSKDIIDQIDYVLGEHYGFSMAELDFIINYDFKYRMGYEDSG